MNFYLLSTSNHEMTAHHFNETFMLILLALTLAVSVVAITQKVKIPFSIGLVVVGLIIGVLNIPGTEAAKEFITQSDVFQIVVISLFLPSLLGEATLKLPYSHLKENRKAITALALGATTVTFLVIGFSCMYLLDMNVATAFTFAALMSATDPISVISLFKTLGVNKRLATIMEGESLFNDGIAVVLFKISSLYLLAYIELGAAGIAKGVLFAVTTAGGAVILGAIMGVLFSRITKWFDDYPLEITFTIILFFGSYFIAETLHVSGVIAVVVAGLIFGNYGTKIGMSPVTRLTLNAFWDVIAVIANSLIFFMVGLEINRINILDKWEMVLVAILIVLLARTLGVYASTFVDKSLPSSWKIILNWGGLKGSLSIALALSLPQSFDGRDEILVLTFGVVLFSLLVQGLTLKPIIKKLGILDGKKGIEKYEEVIASIHSTEKAKEKLEQMKKDSLITGTSYEELKKECEEVTKENYLSLNKLYETYPEIKNEQLLDARREMLFASHESIQKLMKRDIVSDNVGKVKLEEIIGKIEEIDNRAKH